MQIGHIVGGNFNIDVWACYGYSSFFFRLAGVVNLVIIITVYNVL